MSEFRTIPQMVLGLAARRNERTALRFKRGGAYHDVSWRALEQSIRAYARGLAALEVAPGERVAIMSPNCPEWIYADLGAMSIGAITVPVYHTEGTSAIVYILQNSQSRILFAHSATAAAELAARLHEVPQLQRIVLLEGEFEHPRVTPLERFLRDGEQQKAERLEQRMAALDPEAVATLVYTSGTTGQPKGAMLTHRNILANVEAALSVFKITDQDQCLSFLPMSHVFERVDGYYLMLQVGTVIAFAESIDTVPANLQEVHPTLAISVPRLFEKMYARVMERALSGPWLKKQLFFGALKAGRAYVRQTQAGQQPSALLAHLVDLGRKVVFSKLRAPLGGRIRFFISGGAPLSRDIAEFFLAADIPIYEGYGLTETAAGIAVNTPEAHRLGTVGRPFPGTELRIADDGEILVRGPGIFKGYWEDPERTAEAFEGDWFRTGDIGSVDEDGYLKITDRKKDLIVTAGGKNIAPQFLENLVKADKFFANAMVYGDRKPFLTALLVPNLENLEKYARANDIPFLNHCDLVTHPKILELARTRLEAKQENLPGYQQIKRFTLLSGDFSKEQVTPTLKVKRRLVTQHYHQVLEEMYQAKDHGVHDSGFCIVDAERETRG
ncbi:AMP-dependent synthetase [Desulfuromonas versatilis]|uniref:AMP-dependent synthetase n=1 Tax=Desulfuromonas versatilis TaxID=2802975 RepID=A0ABN6E2V7_9BACT|nr:long-chain fatty acid--CoA ligase [Desulfuromonas versatilis]BCR06129.1 AMP-dependent synthetase [Desulfuromonas versatilis]